MALGITEAIDLTGRIADLVKKGMMLEAQERITQLREAVLNAKDEMLQAREDNQGLRAKLAKQENWSNLSSQWTLVQTAGSAVVYRRSDPFEHFACPSCFTKHEIQILQDQQSHLGDFRCPGCGVDYNVKPLGSYTNY